MTDERERTGFRSVLGLPAYRRLWTAQTVSRWGDVFNTVALAVLVFQLTGSGLGVTGVVAAEILPVLLLAPLAAIQALAALSAGATSALLIVLASDHLDVGPEGFGTLLAGIGVGAALGPLVLTRLTDDPRMPAFVFGPLLLRGVVDLVLASVRAFPVAVGALGLYGVGTSTGMVTFNSLLQAETAPETRGRVFAGFDASGSSAGSSHSPWVGSSPT